MPENSRQNSDYYKNTGSFQFQKDYMTEDLESDKYHQQLGIKINEEENPYARDEYDSINSDAEANQFMNYEMDKFSESMMKNKGTLERLNFEEESKEKLDYSDAIGHLFEYSSTNKTAKEKLECVIRYVY